MSEQPPMYPPAPPPPPYETQGHGWSATEAIGYGWRTFRKHPGAFIVITLLVFVVSSIVRSLGGSSSMTDISVRAEIFQLLGQIVATLFAAAATKGALDAVDGKPVSLGSMFEGWSKLNVLLAALIVSIGTVIGFLLLIIPGVIWLFLTWFTNISIIDRNLNAIDGIKASFAFTTQHIGDLLMLLLVSIGVIILGAICLLVGLLVAIPVVLIAGAYTLRVLQGQPVSQV